MSVSKKSLRNVRNPRSSSAMIEFLPKSVIDLLAVKRPPKLTKVDTPDGAKEVNLSEWLWEGSQVQAQEALNTGFIQGIKSGLLDPNDYGGYTVQDAVYCSKATDYYEIALGKTNDQNMKKFIESRIKSYNEYTQIMFQQWHIQNPEGIRMGTAASSYSAYERKVAEGMEPFYLLIAMLPCEKLWEWLAEQIKYGVTPNNVYSFWIEENTGAGHKLATFINENAENFQVDTVKALEVYKNAMQNEVEFFASATVDVV